MRHNLSLDIPEHYNDELLWIRDTSTYAATPAVDCERLDIIRPGSDTPIHIGVTKGFDEKLNSRDLGYTNVLEDTIGLPDGVYSIRYSVSPNIKVFIEYYHLRTVAIENQYYTELCKVDLNGCEPATAVKEQLKEFRLIKMYIEAAKSKVEHCHQIQEGVAILNYVKKILDRLHQKNCC